MAFIVSLHEFDSVSLLLAKGDSDSLKSLWPKYRILDATRISDALRGCLNIPAGSITPSLRGRHRLQRNGQRLAAFEFQHRQICARTIGSEIATELKFERHHTAVFSVAASCRAVALLQPHSIRAVPITRLEVIGMFDVYVRGKSQLLVIRRGAPMPAGLVGGWRKKRAARTVSDEISGAVMREGFYRRSQTALIDTPADVRAS